MSETDTRAKADSILNFLASSPRYGHTTAKRSVVASVMLTTGGQLMACGELWNIKAKSLGAGIYKLSLEPQP